MKFGPKLFLVLTGLILTLVVLSSVVGGLVLQRAYRVVSEDAVGSASQVILSTIADRDKRVRLLLRPLTNDARVKGGLATRAGLADPERLGGNTPEERRQNADDYFGSFMDEYWVDDPEGGPEQDLVLLVGSDGTLAYGEAGDTRRVDLENEVMEHLQVSTLLGAISTGDESARMLWSGPRLRSDAPIVPALESGLYFAAGSRVVFHSSGVGGDEVVGAAVVATHRLGLERVVSTGAEAVFTDRGAAIDSTFRLADAGTQTAASLEQAAARWLADNPSSDAGLTEVWLGGEPYYGKVLPVGGMVKGPVKAGVFYSRAREFETVSTARYELAGIGAFVALLAIAIATALSRSLSRPINEISEAAGKVAGGDLKVLVRADRKDELGDLARRFNQMVQGLRERALAKDALGRYLSPEMAHDVVSGEQGISMQGQRRELTVLFCDVAGFTTISEKLEPEQLVALLNQYLDAMVKVLIRHGAYVDKFEGDAIMAFWNAPRHAVDHAVHACQAILEMRAAAKKLSVEWKAAGQPEFGVRYGLNTGVAIVGNMGATDKINYTAIGDNVNLASRLEGANKQYGTELMISEETFANAAEHIEARELDMLQVKGKLRPVRVYELLALKGQLTPEQSKIRDGFAAGLKLYRARQFLEAKALFELATTDGPSRTFAARCARFLEQPPGPDWDGTYEMQTK
ncbi:MAG: adenylate/guanylate cyclase protein [Myxococcaceae bacterium]|nr:adenylate/guanylate cyclase protein [Myxococcaceae bacterium]